MKKKLFLPITLVVFLLIIAALLFIYFYQAETSNDAINIPTPFTRIVEETKNLELGALYEREDLSVGSYENTDICMSHTYLLEFKGYAKDEGMKVLIKGDDYVVPECLTPPEADSDLLIDLKDGDHIYYDIQSCAPEGTWASYVINHCGKVVKGTVFEKENALIGLKLENGDELFFAEVTGTFENIAVFTTDVNSEAQFGDAGAIATLKEGDAVWLALSHYAEPEIMHLGMHAGDKTFLDATFYLVSEDVKGVFIFGSQF